MGVEVDITTNMDSHKLGRLIYEEIKDYLDAVMDKHAIVKFREFDDLDRMGEYISVMAEDVSATYKHVIIIRLAVPRHLWRVFYLHWGYHHLIWSPSRRRHHCSVPVASPGQAGAHSLLGSPQPNSRNLKIQKLYKTFAPITS